MLVRFVNNRNEVVAINPDFISTVKPYTNSSTRIRVEHYNSPEDIIVELPIDEVIEKISGDTSDLIFGQVEPQKTSVFESEIKKPENAKISPSDALKSSKVGIHQEEKKIASRPLKTAPRGSLKSEGK